MKSHLCVKKMLSSIRMGVWRFVLVAENEGRLPAFKGSAIRGAFGMSLRRMSCVSNINRDCRKCILFENCIYARTFESVNNREKNGDKFLGNYEYLPHPFTFSDKSGGKREYKKGDGLEFEMMLVEPYIEKLPYYIYAVKNAVKKGLGRDKNVRFNLESVRGRNGADIYDPSEDILDNLYKYSVISGESLIAGKRQNAVKLEFITPLRIKSGEKILEKLDFKSFATALLRRVSAIAVHYSQAAVDMDAAEYLKDTAKVNVKSDGLRWHDWERYSSRQKAKMNMGGLVGSAVFEGKELGKYMPLIRMGEILKVGKGTSFGLGEYRIIYTDNI